MLRVEMLPAAQGDALWIEYGTDTDVRRILIDGGTKGSWDEGLRARVERLPPAERRFDLLVVTHIDADHIDGALALLQNEDLSAQFDDVWFNGFKHLPDTQPAPRGPKEGELLTDTIVARGLGWNESFGGGPVAVPTQGALPRLELNGLRITVLSPQPQQLADLKPVWRRVVEEEGLDPDKPRQPAEPEQPPGVLEFRGAGERPNVDVLAALPFTEDGAEPNGTSIVLLLEFEGRSVMLCGDAFPSVVLAGVERLLEERGDDRLRLDAFKLPHHGSHANVSRDLLAKLDCRRYLFSSNGSRTKHPHAEAVARTLVEAGPGATLFFNYSTRFSDPWGEGELRAERRYEAVYPAAGATGITVDI